MFVQLQESIVVAVSMPKPSDVESEGWEPCQQPEVRPGYIKQQDGSFTVGKPPKHDPIIFTAEPLNTSKIINGVRHRNFDLVRRSSYDLKMSLQDLRLEHEQSGLDWDVDLRITDRFVTRLTAYAQNAAALTFPISLSSDETSHELKDAQALQSLYADVARHLAACDHAETVVAGQLATVQDLRLAFQEAYKARMTV
jgi:hypothetical protein